MRERKAACGWTIAGTAAGLVLLAAFSAGLGLAPTAAAADPGIGAADAKALEVVEREAKKKEAAILNGKKAAGEAEAKKASLPAAEPKPEELDQNESVRRQELELAAEQLVVQALRAYRKSRFKEAADYYRQAQAKLRLASTSQPRIVRKQQQIQTALFNLYSDWADSLARDAKRLADLEKFDQAIQKCRQAAEFVPARGKEMDERTKFYLKAKKAAEFRAAIQPQVVDPEKAERDFEINVLLEQGKVFFDNGRYADARDLFEQILLKDPYDVRAIRYLRKISDKLLKIADEKRQTTTAEMLAEVRWKWNWPVTPLLAGPAARVGGRAISKTQEERGMWAKLKNIIIPSITFDDAKITEVIDFLKKRSVELDPDGEGVNIMLQLSAPGVAPQQQQQQPGAGGGMPGMPGAGGMGMEMGGAGMGMGGGAGAMAGPGVGGVAGAAGVAMPGGGEMGMGGMGGAGAGAPGMGMGGVGGAGAGGMGGGGMGGLGGGMGGMGGGGGAAGGGGAEPGQFGMGAVPTGGAASVPPNQRTITLNMNNIPLGEAIRYICLGAGLKYKVESNAVIIADSSVPLDDMETRFYPVEAGVLDAARTRRRMSRLELGLGQGGGGNDNDNGGNDNGNDNTGGNDNDNDNGNDNGNEPIYRFNLVQFFSTLGVSFPMGSSIGYNQRTSKLVVHNTPENLRKVEKILQEINVVPSQVTIEAKFIEIVEDDLQALGFQWLITNGDGNFNDGLILGNGDHRLQVLKQGSGLTGIFAPQLTQGLRFASDVFNGVNEGSDQVLSVNSILGRMTANTIIHALAQQGHSDVLSAPKVTTVSGQTALIKMVTERYFPESWSEPQVTAGSQNQGASYTPSIPEFGDPTDIGVILDVTPTVSADGYSIALELRPQVIDFLGYDDSFNYTMVVNGISVPAKAIMPILSERRVETRVIVWDGETVVLGGMIKEEVANIEDKVPILGDLPLLGRLFRSTGKQNQKTNLLIFVTARLVNPAGLPIRANEVRGLPDFRR